MTVYRTIHRTTYTYGVPMADGFTVAHLLPRSTPAQRVISAEVVVTPAPDEFEETLDAFGNRVVHFAVHEPHATLDVVAESEVEITPPSDLPAGPACGVVIDAVARARGALALDVGPFAAPSVMAPAVPALDSITGGIHLDRPIVDAVRELCTTIYEQFTFDPGFTDIATPIADVLAARRGVCQDFAHVAVAALRSKGLAARYVSGYIETSPPPGQPKLVGADASHAWCSVWVPQIGWLDLDPTNDQLPPRRHVTVGWGRDYRDVAPVRGVVIGPSTEQTLDVSVDVTRIG